MVSLFSQSFIFSQKVFISVNSFDFSGVEPHLADIIVNEIKSKINESSFHSVVPFEKREDDLIQEFIALDGKFRIKPIQIEHLFGNYKLIVGRLERFSDQYLLTAKLINSITGIQDTEISITGSFENLQSTGVDQLVSEFTSAISKNSLR
tara:strand:- start:21 stop:470 length:450 start_codon:yes stop_codon:yes gene_type:complete